MTTRDAAYNLRMAQYRDEGKRPAPAATPNASVVATLNHDGSVAHEFVATPENLEAFRAGVGVGARQERRRVLAALDGIERDLAPMWIEGTAAAKAVAAFVAEVRKCAMGVRS